jgi:hypothetical protein
VISREWAEANIGGWVSYRSYPGAAPEIGQVIRLASVGVFVQYLTHADPQLTYFSDLEPARRS